MYHKAVLDQGNMIRSYKFRLNTTDQQVKILNDTIETCRQLYNDSLGERSADWDVRSWQQQDLLPLGKKRKIRSMYNKYAAKYCKAFYKD